MQPDKKMYSINLDTTSRYLLSFRPDPAPRVRLLRDLLGYPETDPLMQVAMSDLLRSRQVIELECEQWPDGSWGRLHSQDTASPQKIITTEFGVRRALALGLTKDNPVLCRAIDYLHSVIETGACLDLAEKNDRWATGVELFSASTLALIDPDLPVLDRVSEKWLEIARQTFQSGHYDAQAEIDAHHRLTGATVKGSYLVLNNVYALYLLSARRERLPADVDHAIVQWVWSLPHGIGYESEPLWPPPKAARPGAFERWMASLEVLSRFKSWTKQAQPALQWLEQQRDVDGLWDFGARDPGSRVLPLSESWRKSQNRKIDWSVRVLGLLFNGYR